MYDSMRESAQSGPHNRGFMKGMQQALSALGIDLGIARLGSCDLDQQQYKSSASTGIKRLGTRICPRNCAQRYVPTAAGSDAVFPTQSICGGSETFVLLQLLLFTHQHSSAAPLPSTSSLFCLDDAMAFPAMNALASVVLLALDMRNI